MNSSNSIIDVILFSPKKNEYCSAEYLKKIKEEIRTLYNIRFHSIHSSDDHKETIRYSKIFFETNTHILSQKRAEEFFVKFEISLENLKKININSSQFVFSGSAVMGALGLRNPKDLDIFHVKNFILPNNLSSHNSQIKFLNQKIDELIFDPRNFFYYMGFKFLHPKIILEMKINRNKIKYNIKDSKDIEILNKFLNN